MLHIPWCRLLITMAFRLLIGAILMLSTKGFVFERESTTPISGAMSEPIVFIARLIQPEQCEKAAFSSPKIDRSQTEAYLNIG